MSGERLALSKRPQRWSARVMAPLGALIMMMVVPALVASRPVVTSTDLLPVVVAFLALSAVASGWAARTAIGPVASPRACAGAVGLSGAAAALVAAWIPAPFPSEGRSAGAWASMIAGIVVLGGVQELAKWVAVRVTTRHGIGTLDATRLGWWSGFTFGAVMALLQLLDLFSPVSVLDVWVWHHNRHALAAVSLAAWPALHGLLGSLVAVQMRRGGGGHAVGAALFAACVSGALTLTSGGWTGAALMLVTAVWWRGTQSVAP